MRATAAVTHARTWPLDWYTLIAIIGTLIAIIGTLIAIIGTLIAIIGTLIAIIGTLIAIIGTHARAHLAAGLVQDVEQVVPPALHVPARTAAHRTAHLPHG